MVEMTFRQIPLLQLVKGLGPPESKGIIDAVIAATPCGPPYIPTTDSGNDR